MQKFIIVNRNYGTNDETDVVWSCCSKVEEVIDFFFNLYKIYRKGGKKKKKSTIHSASDNEKCILPTSFLPLWVDDMPVFFWPIIWVLEPWITMSS